MAFEVDDVEHARASMPGVSGSVVHALVAHISSVAGDTGLAQALALAAEERPFPVLGDTHNWTAVEDAVALFTAGGLVTGDGAIALHVGQDLLWAPDTAGLAFRIRSLEFAEVAFRHVGALIDQFMGATDAAALETAPGRALVEVAPVGGGSRHAHLCELTRGLLSEIPALFELQPASVSEHECAARGGIVCRYELSWVPAVPDGRESVGWTDAGLNDRPDYATEQPVPATAAAHPSTGIGDDHRVTDGRSPTPARVVGGEAPHGPSEVELLSEQLAAARAALVDAVAEAARQESAASDLAGLKEADARGRAEAEDLAARYQREVERLEHLAEWTSATTIDLCDNEVDALLEELATRADQVVAARRYLLMVRVDAGLPIEIHHPGLDDEEARILASELWGSAIDDEDGSRLVVDIVSPRRRYGRLAVLVEPGSERTDADERVLRLFARHAANVLDVFTVLGDVRRSDTTARTILAFSEKLSGLTNLAQALQILADTVPGMTGCAQSSVYLWDRERSRLVLGAFTAGTTPPDAGIGLFAPRWSPTTSAAHIQAVRHAQVPDAEPADAEGSGQLAVEIDSPMIQRMIRDHDVMVLDARTVEDPKLRTLMEELSVPASVVAPLFAAGEFLGVIAANFSREAASSAIHDPDLHERLSGLADQAATSIQNLELLEKVSHMAWHDSLTGLPNRRLFEDRVEQELVRSRRVGEPVCMFFVDIDNFKTVNDTYGHATGDVLIQEVGRRLVDTVRSQDTVARVGGDEFAILLPGLVDQQSINQLAERTLDAVHTPFTIFGTEVTTSASVGIAIAPEHGDTYDDLLNRADEAMYRAKDQGRDAFEMFRHTPDPLHPGRRAVDDRELHTDLVNALDANEFFLCYQPYIDLRTAEIVGVEALIRWQHPTLGVLEPPQFIPMAEKSDLIVALDSWVLWQGCRQLRSWQDHDIGPLRLSVNLASRDLSSPDFFDSVERTLRDTGIDPSLLELEITERVVLDRNGPAVGNIDRLRQLGVRFTIDNFGSGNSSLDRIGTFPVSTLKIDQSFVQVLGPEDADNSLVSAIIAMASRLGLSCVAEGVETLLQSRLLLQRGCTTAQGYYFSPPLPPEGIEAMLNSQSPAEVPESFGEPPSDAPPTDRPDR
ncbi:MAG: EAL domain-containing protein [Acidimicrobiales bacterium]|jgi:diguanylate cyclase (GGDEF)-like protein